MTWVILLPTSATSSAASLFDGPPVSMAIGTKWCVAVRQAYFVDLLTAAFLLQLRLRSQLFLQFGTERRYPER